MQHSRATEQPEADAAAASGDGVRTAEGARIGADIGWGRAALAGAMIGLGIRGLVYGDFAGVWQEIPIEDLPAGNFFAYLVALLELATGIGLLTKRAIAVSSGVLFAFLLLWTALRLPAVFSAPRVEASWLGFGEIAVILAGGWVVFASNAGEWAQSRLKYAVGTHGRRAARVLFAISLPMIGLSHFVYPDATAGFVPAWLPWPYAWGYLTGAADIVAGCAVLFGIWARLAASLVAATLGVITLLVWLPGVVVAPGNASWTPFLMSSAIACGAWAVAGSYRGPGFAARR